MVYRYVIVTSSKEVLFFRRWFIVCLVVCMCVYNITQKDMNGFDETFGIG